MTEEFVKELLGRLPLRDKFLLRVARYMPFKIRLRITRKYLPFFISEALEFAVRNAKDEMGDEEFQKLMDQLPTEIKDKDGTWILPPGTTREEVDQFLIQLRDLE
ncbi:hypothetical protein ES702_00543 [subsurface metagenome]